MPCSPSKKPWPLLLWKKADDSKASDDERFRALVALATLDGSNARWQKTVAAGLAFVAKNARGTMWSSGLPWPSMSCNGCGRNRFTRYAISCSCHSTRLSRHPAGGRSVVGRPGCWHPFAGDQPQVTGGFGLDERRMSSTSLCASHCWLTQRKEALDVFREELKKANADDLAGQVTLAPAASERGRTLCSLGQAQKESGTGNCWSTAPTRPGAVSCFQALGRRGALIRTCWWSGCWPSARPR